MVSLDPGRSPRAARVVAAGWFAVALGAAPVRAQHASHAGMTIPNDDSVAVRHVMAQVVPLVTHAHPTPGGIARTEAALTQTLLMARARWWQGRAALDATLDAEGVTMPGGELSLGAFGEGFVDRRHPHTYLHELMLTGIARAGRATISATAGRGFAPFGTDDPMVRPFAKYPVNHHLAQILERAILLGAVRVGAMSLEVGTFTGEEPTHPASLPLVRRFGDSWSTRATVSPWSSIELQASYARLSSPEVASGFGLDQRKQSISARASSGHGDRYALAEWARTVEIDHARNEDAFSYESALVEGSMRVAGVGLALRLEQTSRPEEERMADPFRTARPATDLHITGITRWQVATLHVAGLAVTRGPVAGLPFLELSHLTARSRDPLSLFRPDAFYGRSGMWMATAGLRLRVGPMHPRMGRYGVAVR